MNSKPCHCCGGSGQEFDQAVIGDKMRQLRVSKGYSLRQLAKRMKFSAAYVSDLEKGKRNWRNDLIAFYERL